MRDNVNQGGDHTTKSCLINPLITMFLLTAAPGVLSCDVFKSRGADHEECGNEG